MKVNTSKSKFVIIEQKQSRTKMVKDAKSNTIKMDNHTLENPKSLKYLGNQIHEDGTAATISETLTNRIP